MASNIGDILHQE